MLGVGEGINRWCFGMLLTATPGPLYYRWVGIIIGRSTEHGIQALAPGPQLSTKVRHLVGKIIKCSARLTFDL